MIEQLGGVWKRPQVPHPASSHLPSSLVPAKPEIRRRGTMVEKTLEAMRHGGIFDQLGFGFHRYSVDERWLIPHFEKMLYDQALLAMAYVEAVSGPG